MVQNVERYPLKTTLIFITCMNFIIVCMIIATEKSVQQKTQNFRWFNFKCVISADEKILKSATGKHFLTICSN